MPAFRDNQNAFVAALEDAATEASYPLSIVLKDYWVCQLLGALHKDFPGTFLLKGGTSLAKGWGLIDRMSEDVDILVSEAVDEGNEAREQRLLDMTDAAAGTLGLAWRTWRQPGRAPNAHRDDLFIYDSLDLEVIGVDPEGVLLQSGYGQGWEPHELIDVRPILASAVGEPEEFDDLATIRVPALRPVRTLAEKLHALHCAVTDLINGGDLDDEDRIARHYYDVYCCLGHAPTLQDLNDAARMQITFADVERISRDRYGARHPRPTDGWATSPAFQPGMWNEVRDRLEAAYARAMDLMRIEAREAGAWPSLGQVLQRVEQHAALL